MLTIMHVTHALRHVANSYINDNLARFKAGLLANKTAEQIERNWSQGLMESLGYHHVEAFDRGLPKGKWNKVEVHWIKTPHESMEQ
jgi:hypothetical protein